MSKNPINNVLGIFSKLSMQQKVLIGATILITVVLLGSLLVFLNEPNYSVLYANLSEEDASKTIEQLSTDKIPYQIDDNGKTIKVPKDMVYETRLKMAGQGIPSSGFVGYELFDKTTMGMSDFMQKLNYKRAIEGELARTIMQQEGIEGVRVHIVIPQKSVFRDEEKLPTASVVLKMNSGKSLSKGNIQAIVNLVSGSVEGLQPGKVTLLDNKGRLLSRETDEDPLAVSSSKQYEVKQSVENYLASKAQNILDNVVGYGNAMIQVNADINFDQVEKTIEQYDPETQVAISEQSVKTNNGGKSVNDSTTESSENTTVNYEISKTLQRVVEGSGNINRLTVAVVVNDKAKEVKKGEVTETIYQPRSQEELQKLEEIVKNAVGLNENRQDQFSIVNMSFEMNDIDEIKPEEPTIMENVDKYSNIFLILAGVVGAMLLLKSLMNKLKNEKIIIGTTGGAIDVDADPYSPDMLNGNSQKQLPPKPKKQPIPIGNIEDEINDEALRLKAQQEKIQNYVSRNPIDAAKLINSWLHEDEFQ